VGENVLLWVYLKNSYLNIFLGKTFVFIFVQRKQIFKNSKSNKMSNENFLAAIEILTTNNKIKVSFNTPVEDHYSNVYKILIHESNASVITELVAAGFSVAMSPKGLSVNKY
jgi:hypothetical protein